VLFTNFDLNVSKFCNKLLWNFVQNFFHNSATKIGKLHCNFVSDFHKHLKLYHVTFVVIFFPFSSKQIEKTLRFFSVQLLSK